MTEFLPFCRPSISEGDLAAVAEVLRSGWITTGAKNAEFEKAFSQYVGVPNAAALASATAGMHLVLKALGIGPGDEVITPSMTWVSTVNLIVLSGAKPVFAEVDRDTLLISPDSVKACLNDRTKAVIPVHFAGVPADLDALEAITRPRGITLIEDAAHALGAYFGERHVGRDHIAIYSFHPIKNITTGEGGMVTAPDEGISRRLRSLKFHGLGVDAFDRQTHGRAPQAEVIEPGYKYNLTDIAAALGLSQLKRSEEFIARRAALAELYLGELAFVEELAPLALPPYPVRHAWNLMIVRVMEGARIGRDEFMHELKLRGIGAGLHFRAVHLQKYYREAMGMRPGSLPETEWNSDRICSLPLFPDMTAADVHRVVEAAKAVFKR